MEPADRIQEGKASSKHDSAKHTVRDIYGGSDGMGCTAENRAKEREELA